MRKRILTKILKREKQKQNCLKAQSAKGNNSVHIADRRAENYIKDESQVIRINVCVEDKGSFNTEFDFLAADKYLSEQYNENWDEKGSLQINGVKISGVIDLSYREILQKIYLEVVNIEQFFVKHISGNMGQCVQQVYHKDKDSSGNEYSWPLLPFVSPFGGSWDFIPYTNTKFNISRTTTLGIKIVEISEFQIILFNKMTQHIF
jgi:hypothetical protein